MKVSGHVPESLICPQVDINNMQFGFMSGAQYYKYNINPSTTTGGTPYWKEENLHHIVDLEKAFDHLSCSILWWALT